MKSLIESFKSLFIKPKEPEKKSVMALESEQIVLPSNVNEDENFIFIHIPKCAGTSVYQALGMKEANHMKAVEYSTLLGESYDKYLKFAIVRNPFDRFVSLYNYARMENSYYHSAIDPEKSLYGKHWDYDILKNASLEQALDLLLEDKLTHGHGQVQWHPQTKWLLDENNKLIVEYIGRLEDIDLHFGNICRLLKREELSLKKQNASSDISPNNSQKLFTPQMREKLVSYYKSDFEMFGYAQS